MSPVRKLKVLHIVPDLETGGAERQVTTLFTALDRTRFEPSVLCLGREGALFDELSAGGVHATALHRTKRQALRALIELTAYLRRTRPDLVVVRGYSAEALGRIAARLVRIPVVVWVHHCGDDAPRGRVRRALDRVLAFSTVAWFGVAQAQISYMIDELGCPPEKIRIIYNGVDPERFDPLPDKTVLDEFGITAERPVVGILAALRSEKDHANLLHATQIILERHPDTVLLVIGDGPMRENLHELADSLGITDSVVFTGSRRDPEVLLRAVDVFVLASFTIECFPMALLEAMAAGRPAVCTDVGGIREIIVEGETGYLVPARDSRRLADRIEDLLDDPEKARSMGCAARRRVEECFTLRRSIDDSEQKFVEVVEGRVRAPIRMDLVLDRTFVGGAEMLMLGVFRHFDPALVRPRLICLREAGPLAEDFRSSGFDVEVLGRAGRYDPRTVPRLVRSFYQNKTDAVLVTHHHRASLALGRAAALLARVPVNLVAAHDMDLTRVGRRCLPRWAVDTLFLSDALVLLSERQGEYLCGEEDVGNRRRRRTRHVVIPNGIEAGPPSNPSRREHARRILGVHDDEFVIGIVARLSPQKAHEVLLRAVSELVHEGRNVRLLVIGGGPREEELRSLAVTLEIDGSTTFTGIRRDVVDLLPGLDVACLSSVHEGVPVTVLEAMAAGLPVVATDCGSIRDLLEDGVHGYVVPVGDSDALAARLGLLADNPQLRAGLGRAGRTRVEHEFSIARTARGYERLLTETVVS